MSTPSGLTFLQSIAGYTQNIGLAENPSANAPIRLAVIDPAYVHYSYPGTLPKVTFEGEETLSDKRYVVIDRSYKPGPSDRVVMLPVGHTYVIAGVISPAEVQPFWDQADVTATVTSSSTSYVSLTGGPSATLDLRAGQLCRIVVSCQERAQTAGTNGVIMSFRKTGASGTIEAIDMDGQEAGIASATFTGWMPMSREGLFTATTAGSHTFEARYRVIGSVTGEWKNRRILAHALN